MVPELWRILQGGYTRKDASADIMAGVTVAILALPLSLAIAIGSGADPAKGLVSSVIGGILISGLGGTRFQIGGPAAAFITIIGGIVAQFGYDGLLIAAMMAGLMLVAAALLGLGTYAKYVPGPVILGFTSGLGTVIAAGQLKDFLGLSVPIPAEFIERLAALWHARAGVSLSSLAIGLLTMGLVIGLRKYLPKWPGLLIAIVVGSVLVTVLGLDVATIGSRFGEMPRGLPLPTMPAITLARIQTLLPTAMVIALLVGVESLLSATAADAIAGTRHRPNTEVFAQGIANIVASLFGGLPVTGVIARTGTNIQAGARTPVAGIVHALVVLLSVIVLAPLVSYLALPSLAAVLLTVAWRLMELHGVWRFMRIAPRDDAVICVITMLLTIFVDLQVAIAVGVSMAALLFMHRMSELPGHHVAEHDPMEATEGVRQLVFRGPMFFGQSARITDALRDARHGTRVLLVDVAEVPLIDATAIEVLEDIAHESALHGSRIIIAGLQDQPREALTKAGVLAHDGIRVVATIEDGFDLARTLAAGTAG